MNIEENNHKRTVSRLIIGKILSSSSSKWMKSKSYDKISLDFLSSDPEKDLYISYVIKRAGVEEYSYGSEILNLSTRWVDHTGEILDPVGNVWKACQLYITANICSTYGDKVENFAMRAECIGEVANLIGEIREMVSGPIRTMILDNSGRIDRDKKKLYEDRCYSIRKSVGAGGYTRNLRKGGSPHTFSRDNLQANIPPGKYEIQFESGTKRNPVVKKYVVYLSENPTFLVSIHRTA